MVTRCVNLNLQPVHRSFWVCVSEPPFPFLPHTYPLHAIHIAFTHPQPSPLQGSIPTLSRTPQRKEVCSCLHTPALSLFTNGTNPPFFFPNANTLATPIHFLFNPRREGLSVRCVCIGFEHHLRKPSLGLLRDRAMPFAVVVPIEGFQGCADTFGNALRP